MALRPTWRRRGPDADLAVELAPAEHLDQRALVGEALGRAALRGRPRRVRRPRCVSRLIAWYSTRNGLLKPLQLRHTHVQRHLAALEVHRDRAAGALALRAAAGGLAALAADAAADALARRWSSRRAGFRSWIFMQSSTSSTFDEMRHLGDHPADLGAVGQGVRLADAAEAERPQRAALLRLGPDARSDLGDLRGRPSRQLDLGAVRAALGLACTR